MNHLPYLRIPYKHLGRGWDGVDCFGLIRLVYQESLGIVLADPPEYGERWFLEHPDKVAEYAASTGFVEVDCASIPGDVVAFDWQGELAHLGVFVGDGYYLHASRAGVSCQPMHRSINRIRKVYRYDYSI